MLLYAPIIRCQTPTTLPRYHTTITGVWHLFKNMLILFSIICTKKKNREFRRKQKIITPYTSFIITHFHL
ncbi:hypothetical protein N782_14935 [Pontibacillus yanchengensis Y32]|uniref:Uncharacterized protein n=1 Tax=Pontibacillus yanchengensis Y32 TaxID=1385514 RepID=A0A0A2TFC5_9BACI|nr:hypothetical protein N782_14935 [Pontibacillus yanchengensis Y32]